MPGPPLSTASTVADTASRTWTNGYRPAPSPTIGTSPDLTPVADSPPGPIAVPSVVPRRRGERRDLVDDHRRFGLEDRLTHRSLVEPVHHCRPRPEGLDDGEVLGPVGAGRDLLAPVHQRLDQGPTHDPGSPATNIRTVVSLR